MAYGLSTYRLSEQDDTMFSNDMSASRRAVSVGALTSRNRGSLTQRSHHHSVVLSPSKVLDYNRRVKCEESALGGLDH